MPPLGFLHLGQNTKQILHVVAYLVRNHIGLGELTALAPDLATAEAPFEILKERRVEVDLLIVRTVKWAHG